MTEPLVFPLTLWESTKDCEQTVTALNERLSKAKQILYNRGFECTYFGGIEVTPSGNLAAWLNDCRPIYTKFDDSAAALETCKRYGYLGWWEVEDVEEFIQGRGIILDAAMDSFGFRHHKKHPEQWVRKNKDDPRPYKADRPVDEIVAEEAQRLSGLIVEQNVPVRDLYTYRVSGDQYGIFMQYNVSPFMATTTEQMPYMMALQRRRGHIAREQKDFTLDARTIKMNDQHFVHVKTKATGGTERECVWPSVVPSENYPRGIKPALYQLGDELVRLATSN